MPKQQQQQRRTGKPSEKIIPKDKKSRPRRSRRTPNAERLTTTRISSREIAPIAYGSVERTGAPRIMTMKNGDFRIVHKEYLGDVIGSVAFASTEYKINVGSPKTFPWLSARARGFEKYRLNKLRFSFETTTATSTIGSVMLIPDYDPGDKAPTNKVQALSYADSARGQPWENFCFDARAENLHAVPQYFVSSGVPVPTASLNQYNVGNMFLCTDGMANTNVVGELYVHYDVTLITPDSSLPAFDSLELIPTAGISSSAPLGTSSSLNGTLDITQLNATTLQFNQFFNGLIVMQEIATDAGSPVLTGTATSSAVSVPSGLATQAIAMAYVTALPGQTLIFNLSGAVGLSAFNVFISPLDPSSGYAVLF